MIDFGENGSAVFSDRELSALDVLRDRAKSSYKLHSYADILRDLKSIVGSALDRLERPAERAMGVDLAAPDGDRTAAVVIAVGPGDGEPAGDPNANAGDDLRAIIDAWNKEFHVSTYTREEYDSFRAWYVGVRDAVSVARRNVIASARTGRPPKFSDVKKAVAALVEEFRRPFDHKAEGAFHDWHYRSASALAVVCGLMGVDYEAPEDVPGHAPEASDVSGEPDADEPADADVPPPSDVRVFGPEEVMCMGVLLRKADPETVSELAYSLGDFVKKS